MNILHAPNTLSKPYPILKCENITTLAQTHNPRLTINDIKQNKLKDKLSFVAGYSISIQKVLIKLLAVYNYSIKNNTSCRPSDEYLARVTGISVSGVKRAISWLKQQNVIAVKITQIGLKAIRVILDIGSQKVSVKTCKKVSVRFDPVVKKENTNKKKEVSKVSNRHSINQFEKLIKPLFRGHSSYERFLEYWSNEDGTVSINLNDIGNVKRRIKQHIRVNAYSEFKEMLTDGKFKIHNRQFRLVEDLLLEFKGIPEKYLINRLKSLGSGDMRAVFKESDKIRNRSGKINKVPLEGLKINSVEQRSKVMNLLKGWL